MKPAAILIILLLTVFLIASFFLLVQFDANKYRGEIEKNIERELAVHAKIGHVSLHWGLGVGFEIQGMILRDPDGKTTLLKADKAVLMLDGYSLIRRRLIFKSIAIDHPEINLVISRDGRWNYHVQSLLHLPDSQSRTTGRSKNVALYSLKITDATLHFQNDSGKFLPQVTLSNFSMRIEQPHSAKPVQYLVSTNTPSWFSLPVSLEALYNPQDDHIEFYVACGPKIIEIEGIITAWHSQQPLLKVDIGVHQYDLGRGKAPATGQTFINQMASGIVTAQIEGQGSNVDPGTFMENITLAGSIDIRDGSLKKSNIVRGVLEKLSPVPGFSKLIFMQAPQKLKPLFENHTTPFSIFQSNFKYTGGILTIDNAILQHRDYLIAATGKYASTSRKIDLICKLICLNPMSRFLTEKLPETETMKNRQGRVIIPFFYTGLYPEDVRIQAELIHSVH